MTSTSTTRAFCRPNLSSADVLEITEPWLNTEPLPTFESKDAYRAWCSHPGTQHVFFTMAEPEVPSLPIGAGNKPRKIHGFCADYDAEGVRPEDFERALNRVSKQFAPYAWNITRSGGGRCVWLFEEPIPYFGNSQWKRFVARLKRELKITSFLAGYDDKCDTAGHYFTAGAGWSLHPARPRIRAAALHLWLAETSRDDDFDGHGVEIPVEIVAAEVERRFPGRWEGPFVLGARGVRFFDPTADAQASIVRPSGMQCFTGPAPFMTWEAIFGREFVQRYLEDRLGAAIRDIYYDGRTYFRQLPDERWDTMTTEVAKRHLAVRYGLCPRAGRDENESECDRALHRIEITKQVTGALPFPHNPNRIVTFNGRGYLNIATAKLWPAALDEQEWGANFPWLANYLATLFDDERSLQVFLAWLHVWAKSLHEGTPRKGHALFIVGPPGTGKTLLSTQILSRMVGGFAEATQYIVEGNRYNDAMFDKALLTIDDALPGSDRKAHARFSALVKAIVANGTFRYERKYGKSMDVPFDGRLIVTLNDDPNSLSILPDTDLSLLDKVIMLRTGDLSADVSDDVQERYATIERELSPFVRWVLDYQIPDWIEREARFGIRAYHDPSVLQDAQEVTATASIMEIIDIWKAAYRTVYPDQTEWKGTPTQLLGHLKDCAQTTHAVSHMNNVWIGRMINQAISNGMPGFSRRREGQCRTRVIVINLTDEIPQTPVQQEAA